MKDFFKGNLIINYLIFIILGFVLSVVFFKLVELDNANKEKLEKKIRLEEALKKQRTDIEDRQKELEFKDNIFKELEIEALSFFIFDLNSEEEIFSKNKNKKTGIASLTKVATSDIFLENYKDDTLEILFKNLQEEGNNQIYTGEVFSFMDAVNFMMIASSNDIASALTNNMGRDNFLREMNALAEKLKMDSTLFFSESGLDINKNIAGAYSSAGDILKLVKYFYKKYPDLSKDFSVGKKTICSDLKCHSLLNTNELFIDKNNFSYDIIFSKTGYTQKTGGSLAMIVKILDKEVVLIALGSSKDGRFSDINKMADATKFFFQKR